jgi:polar amino acid transport system substrate-binding protein
MGRPYRPVALALACALLLAGCTRPGEEPSACTGTTADLVRDGSLLVGVSFGYRPFAFRQEREPKGLEVDVARALAERLNLELVLADRASSALVPGLLSRRFDLAASGLRGGPALDQAVCATSSYLRADLAVAVAANAPADAGAETGTVVVENHTPGEDWARDNVDASRLLVVQTTDDLLAALRSGKADAAVLDLVVALGRGGGDVRVVERIRSGNGYVFALRPGNRGLRDAVDSALGSLRADGTLQKILSRWLGEDAPRPSP